LVDRQPSRSWSLIYLPSRQDHHPADTSAGAGVAMNDIAARIDPRLVFLARAGARHTLVISGAMTLDEAFDGLSDAFDDIAPCRCRWERLNQPFSFEARARA
jgi:hypothetical protein